MLLVWEVESHGVDFTKLGELREWLKTHPDVQFVDRREYDYKPRRGTYHLVNERLGIPRDEIMGGRAPCRD